MLLSRPFSAAHTALDAPPRCPSLADITPDGVATFDSRQKDFRAKTTAAQRARQQQESQSAHRAGTPSASVASHETNASTSHLKSSPKALGSLTTHATEAESAAKAEHGSKRKGALSSLIYGTHEGQEMDREIQRSFSQVLARGKYVHSIVFHKVKPDKVDEYVALVGDWYPKMASKDENKVNLVGSWRTEVGDCDTFGMYPLFGAQSYY